MRRQALSGGFDVFTRHGILFVLAVVLILASVLPWPMSTVIAPLPLLAMVHYWTAHRPDLMPPAVVFLLGLLQDLIGGGPIGLTAMLLLIVQLLVSRQRHETARTSFLTEFAGFAMAAGLFEAVNLLCVSLYHMRLFSPEPLVLQYMLGLFLYPLLSGIFQLTRSVVPGLR